MSQICSHCHFENDDSVSFCRSCGAPVNADLKRIMEAERVTKDTRRYAAQEAAPKPADDIDYHPTRYQEKPFNPLPLVIAALVVAIAIIGIFLFL